MTDASEAIEAVKGVIFDWVFVICGVEGSATDGLRIVETVKEGLDAIYMLIIRSLALEDDMVMEVSWRPGTTTLEANTNRVKDVGAREVLKEGILRECGGK